MKDTKRNNGKRNDGKRKEQAEGERDVRESGQK